MTREPSERQARAAMAVRAILLAASVMLAALGASASAFAAGASTLKPLYAKGYAALSRGDFDTYMTYIDGNADFVDEKGQHLDAAQYMMALMMSMPTWRNYKATFTLSDERAEAGRITAKVETRIEVEALRVGGWARVDATNVSEDVWEKKGGAWKLVSSRTLHSTTSVQEPPKSSGGAGDSLATPYIQCMNRCIDMTLRCPANSPDGGCDAQAEACGADCRQYRTQ